LQGKVQSGPGSKLRGLAVSVLMRLCAVSLEVSRARAFAEV
jgi:hypothetical protein